MKKFMKACTIWALILVSGGLTLAVAGVCITGNSHIRQTVETVTNGRVHVNLDPWDIGNFGIYVGSGGFAQQSVELAESVEGVLISYDDAIFTTESEAFSIIGEETDTGGYPLKDQDIRDLKVDVGDCEFRLLVSKDDEFYLEAEDPDGIEVSVKNKELHIKSEPAKSPRVFGRKNNIVLFVPENVTFREAKIELGAGSMSIEQLFAKEIEIEAGAGEIRIGEMEAGETELTVGAGGIYVSRMQTGKLKTSVGYGNLSINGSISDDSKIECGMGNVTLNLSGKEEDFSYKIECAMGSVSLNGVRYSGLTADKEIKNRGGKLLKLECAMGNIEIRTEENDG